MLNSFYVIPGYTFFYWGFTLPKREYSDFIKNFKLGEGNLVREIVLLINGKKHKAKVRLARIKTPKFANREVVQIFYDREYDTLKAFRKLFVYSYAATINKTRSDIKELMELEHVEDNLFRVKVRSKQKTDFDEMFDFLEEKNLFEYWKNTKQSSEKNFFIDYSRTWIPKYELHKYAGRVNVIYLLYNSAKKQLYVGKANILGDRVKQNEGRVGLDRDWDKFMFFEIDPEYSAFIEQIEAFTIRTFASLMQNDVGMNPINEKNVKLVNRQLKN